MPNRQILDNIMIVQEALHSSVSRKEQGIIVKLDMENAFDIFNLSFISTVFKKFGLSSEIIEVTRACIVGPWIAPLINGRPSEFFQSSQGLRQGCPLSPFLLVDCPYPHSSWLSLSLA